MFRHITPLAASLFLISCLIVPCVGCGSTSSEATGVEDDGMEEFEEMQEDPAYIEAEEKT